MKTNLLKGVVLGTFLSVSTIASAQVLNANLKQMTSNLKPKVEVASLLKNTKPNVAMKDANVRKAAADLKAGYYYPLTLSPLVYAMDDQGYFTSFAHYAAGNSKSNVMASESDPTNFDYQFLPLGVDENGNAAVPVVYYDASTGNPTDYHWTAQTANGVAEEELASADGEFYYGASEGRFPYPTQTVTSAAGTQTYTAPGRLKVGQKTEVSLSNWFQLGNSPETGTFGLGMLQLQDNKGYFPGSNSIGLEGFGNFYCFPGAVVLHSVKVYVAADATVADPNNEIELNVYKPDMNVGLLNGELVATAKLKYSEMTGSGLEEIGIGYKDAQGNFTEAIKVANFVFDAPITLNDQLYLFAVENIGNDLSGGDSFAIAVDQFNVKPQSGDEDVTFAHHSFVRAETTTGIQAYFPVSKTIGGTEGFTFYINPIIASVGSETSIEANRVADNKATATVDADGNIVASAEGANFVNVYNATGAVVYSSAVEDVAVMPASAWVKGLYIIKFDNGATVKVVR